MTQYEINEHYALAKWNAVDRLGVLIDLLKQISPSDLMDAGKQLGIDDPIATLTKDDAISICLRACARNIARKRIKHQGQVDLKRRQAGDIA